MRVGIAGEFSGRVRDAFIRRGHYAKSCDYRPTEAPGPHYQGSWFDLEWLREDFDLLIAHPDCTFLVVSGARWMRQEYREEAQLAALHTVKAIMKLPIERIAIENPVGKLSSLWRGPESIRAAVSLRRSVSQDDRPMAEESPGARADERPRNRRTGVLERTTRPNRKRNRARTYPGIADAMAEQWGNLAEIGRKLTT